VIALNRILVPTNLGQPSRAAIKYGVEYARQFRAQLFLLHVLPTEDYEAVVEAERVLEQLVPDDGRPPDLSPDAVVRTVARADLRRLLDGDEERDARAEYFLLPAGSDGPHAAITACAREQGIDLIIMGKHGIGRVEHLLGGSVTERVVRHAPCAVLVLPHTTDRGQ
jgi:nucleotide-binding universal stress UspA family protein